jgi:hypothetical protein
LGLISAWMLYSSFASDQFQFTMEQGGGLQIVLLILLGGLVLTGPCWIAMVSPEFLLLRRSPGSVAAYVRALSGRLVEPCVAHALLRGAAAGVILAGIETLFSQLSLGQSWRWSVIEYQPMEQLVRNTFPALSVLGTAILRAFILGLVLFGWGWGEIEKQAKFRAALQWTFLPFAVGIAAFWWRFDLASPGAGLMIVCLLEGLTLAWLMNRYDVLTVIMTVFTLTLWTVGFPLLQVFSEIGNGSQLALFSVWGGGVLLSVLLAHRHELVHRWRTQADMD